MEQLLILKLGGGVLDDPASLAEALDYFSERTGRKLLVHGGGRKASALSKQMGLAPKLIDGRRITDAATLEVVVMVYAGLLNKQVVADLQARACNAIGLSGADGDLIRAHKRPVREIDYGFAGDIEQVAGESYRRLIEAGFTPVCCPITHNGQGQLLNTNADTIAADLAIALLPYYQVELEYYFDRPGVLLDSTDDNSLLVELHTERYAELSASGAIHTGMLPKLDNAFRAQAAGVTEVRIGNKKSLRTGTATRLH